nr:immunoglobulin heavy chain junction region [Macaca mulatta]MOV39297.1 immunoglobulin heavy chain junction region [Macaca mulatta]MOV39972.1 immunoglobulin heavy chain junction region [Macaca mulatta]MOV46466.1 immunoglobulin heavy chain junction region [Macaca mulatta]MOV46846.1 immunoglobulin heavy chain junction region [Macaca mulatta]
CARGRYSGAYSDFWYFDLW